MAVEGMGDIEQDAAFGPLRMKPRRERANEGRANPKGVPCLYLANRSETAMSEVRPWVGALVSVAQFKTVKELKIVDCSVLHGQYMKLAYLDRTFDAHTSTMSAPSPNEVDNIVWAAIDGAFSQPVTSADDYADYAPTQILAELFRSEGYDGLAYKSAFGEVGYNIALFDIDSAIQLNGFLHSVEHVVVRFCDDPRDQYFLKDGVVTRMVITSIEPIPAAKFAKDE
jgi:RES domain-containing protein